MVSLVFFDILQLPRTVISNSEKLTHPSIYVYKRHYKHIYYAMLYSIAEAVNSCSRKFYQINNRHMAEVELNLGPKKSQSNCCNMPFLVKID